MPPSQGGDREFESRLPLIFCQRGSVVEQIFRKDWVMSSILIAGSKDVRILHMERYNYSPRSSFKPRSLRRYESKAKNKLFSTVAISGFLVVIFFVWGLPTLIGGLSFLNKFKNTPKVSSSAIEDAAIAPPVL